MDVRFLIDPRAFLDEAAPFLAAHPVRCSVVASIADRGARRGMPDGPFWFAFLRDGEEPVGVAMRTHPDPPHAGFAVTMPESAVRALADALEARGEVVAAWNGDIDAGRQLTARAAAALGGEVAIAEHLRLFELRDVVWPRRPEGSLRRALPQDLELVCEWVRAFHRDAETQGGREYVPQPGHGDPEHVLARIEEGSYRLWEVDGRPVHLLGATPPAFGVVRIGPVYTPEAERGKGYAGWAVATLSQGILDAGNRPCLYTDQANPVSNKVYERIGYVALGDEAEHVVRRP